MGERFRRSTSLSLFLQPVVADGLGQLKTFLQVAVLHRTKHLVVVVCPYAGIVVGQQLQADADLIATHLVGLTHGLMGLVERSQEVLHVVAYLVGNDVGVGKIATLDTQLALHLGEERQVNIQLLVARAIEGTDGSRSRATGRLHLIREQHQRRRRIGTSHLLEHLSPYILRTSQNLTRELCQLLLLLSKVLLIDGLSTLRHLFLNTLYNSLHGVASAHPSKQGCY